MPYCSNCGTQNIDAAKFCISCGAPMQNVTTGQKANPQLSSVPQQLNIGSRVSFIAGDGKTYTGTVKEINGNQYKVKYDAFNFETWLGSNQFTLIGGSTAPPVYTPGSNPLVTHTNTSASAPGMSIITHMGFWGAIIILIGFFTNWINAGYLGGQSITGFTFVRYASDILGASDNETALIMLVAISVIVLSSIICLLYILGVGIGRGAFVFFKLLPLVAIIGFIIYSVMQARETGLDPDIESPSAWKILGIGIYLTLAGSLLLAISRSRK